MALSQSERLRAVIKWYSGQTRLTHKKISEALGYSNATFFSQMLNGHKEIPKALPPPRAQPKTAISLKINDVAVFLFPILSTFCQSV